jgi:predicted enzyme related to lactoylglutathione lyase
MAAPVVWFEIAGRDLDALTRFSATCWAGGVSGAGRAAGGGKVIQRPTPISETARVAMLLDPEGHRIGLLEQS